MKDRFVVFLLRDFKMLSLRVLHPSCFCIKWGKHTPAPHVITKGTRAAHSNDSETSFSVLG